MDSKKEPASEAKELEIKAEKYANRVLDTRKRSGAFNGYIAGYRASQEEITRLKAEFSSVRNTFSEMNKKLMNDIIELKAELERERELRKELVEWIQQLPYEVILPDSYFGSLYSERCEALIEKSKI